MSFLTRIRLANRPVSLRFNLLVLVVAAIMPLLIFAAAMVVRSSREERRTFRRGATERTLAVMTAVDIQLRGSVTTLNALATSDHIDSGDMKSLYDEARRILRTQPDWFTIHLASVTGQQLINLSYPYGARLPPVSEAASFEEVLRTGKPAIGDLRFSDKARQHLFRVRVPVFRGGTLKYVLSAAVTPRALSALLEAQRVPSEWLAAVVDRNGRVLARTKNPEKYVGRPAAASLRDTLKLPPEGWMLGSTMEGAAVYIAYHRSSFSGWTMAMGIPVAAVQAQFRRSVLDITSFGLILLGLAVAMAWMLSTSTARSIASLAVIAEHLGLGHDRPSAGLRPAAADTPSNITDVEEVKKSLLKAGRLIRDRSAERDRVEAELRAVTEWFELAQEAANIGAFERDLDKGVVRWSPSEEMLYGLKPRSFGGKHENWQQHVHPDDLPAIESVVSRAIAELSPYQVQYRIFRLDGSLRWIESQARVVADRDGRPCRVVGIDLDVTEAKRAERRLQLDDAIHRVLAESPALPEAARKIVQVLCETAGWDVSALWCVESSTSEIACLELWHVPSINLPDFKPATVAKRFRLGESLVGGVWQSGRPVWLSDVASDPRFARAAQARSDGLSTAVCFPIKLSRDVLGVIECFSRDAREPDADFLQMLPAIGGQIGQFIRRKRAEDELRESEERLRAVVDSAVDGIITIDENGVIGTVNPAAERIFGYTAGEMIGQNVSMLMPEPYREAHDSYIGAYLRTGERKIIGTKREVPGRRKDGTIFPLELGVSERRLGTQRIFTGLVRDITDLKRAAEALVEQARLLDLTKDAILVRDASDRILYWSRGAEELYGWNRKDALGKVSHELLRTEFTRPLPEIVTDLHRDSRWSGDLVHRRSDGAPIYVSTRWVLDRDRDGRPVSVLETNTDITERKKAEDALRDADRRKDEFLAMLGHELRNPLGVISNTVHLLRWTETAGPPAELHDIIERQVAHMSELVDDLLDVSRISRGQIGLAQEICDLSEITRATVADYRGTMESSGLRLEATTPEEPVWINGDRTRLAQIIGNVLHNAEKFTPAGGRVTVELNETAGSSATLTVRDTGIGMQPEMLTRLFEPFAQSDRTLDRKAGGLGLGLALVKGLVELHGGEVRAHSEGLGRGAEFTVRLPVASRPGRIEIQSKRRTVDSCARRILIIEDNLAAARTMRMFLRRAGHEVDEAHSGMEGIEGARRFDPDVILCDIGLPGMDGYAVARQLRQEPATATAYMIAVSGYGQEEDKRRSLEAGFDMHLTKPADLKRLRQLLSRPLQRPTAMAV